MCGRYTQTRELEELSAYFGFSAPETELTPRYNISPGQSAPVVVWDEQHSGRVLKLLRWGLVPFWAKDESIGNKLINARGETLAEKPSFRQALAKRRCLVLADGFYEWAKRGAGKQPYYIYLKGGGAFAFAGLWERWKAPAGDWVETFTIVTTEPNEFMRPIHDRMPVILPRAAEQAWLHPDTPLETLTSLLTAYDPAQMQAHAVSPQVNSPANQAASLILPLDPPPAD